MVQGHFYDSSLSSDPWTTIWDSDVDGSDSGYFTIDYGFNTIADNLGHAVVVHESDGTRAACGVIGNGDEYLATVAAYPDYTGEYIVSGYVVVAAEYDGANTMRISCGLSGLEASTTGGIHIHIGTTCEDSEGIGENYYNSTYTNGIDPWTEVWDSDASGESTTAFVIDTGYSPEDNLAHSVIIEDSSGIPISCGIIISNASISNSGISTTSVIIIVVCVVIVVILLLIFWGLKKLGNSRNRKPAEVGDHKWAVLDQPEP